MIKGYQAELMDMYEKTRTEENRKLAKRREEIKNKYPERSGISNNKGESKLSIYFFIISNGCFF